MSLKLLHLSLYSFSGFILVFFSFIYLSLWCGTAPHAFWAGTPLLRFLPARLALYCE